MISTIANEFLEVAINSQGGELHSVKDKRTGQELLFQGSEVWPHQDVIPFPWIGPNETYTFAGKKYTFKGNHGFLRNENLHLENKNGDSLTLSFTDTPETYALYPFHFIIKITYSLTKNSLKRSYEITSLSKDPVPFALADHAAYQVKFGTARLHLGEGPLEYLPRPKMVLDATSQAFPYQGDWAFSKDDFKKFETVLLVNPHRPLSLTTGLGEELTYHFHSPYIAIWSPAKEAEFLCVEPWWGLAPYKGMPERFIERKDMNFAYPTLTLSENISFKNV